MQDQILLKISVITDDDTGVYNIGELDFGKTGHCENYLKTPQNRANFVKYLRWLADAAERGESPFFPIDGIKHPTYGTLAQFLHEVAETIKQGEYPRIGHDGAFAWFVEQYEGKDRLH